MMRIFKIHDVASAPDKSHSILEDALKNRGRIPNLYGVLAESPQLLEGYVGLHKLFENSSFNKEELTVVWQTINVEHECTYCVPAHTLIAKSMGVDSDIIEALRNGTFLPSDKLQVLHTTTLLIVRNRGVLTDTELERFYDVGFENRHLLDIILGLSQKVISNYVNHLAKTPLDNSV
ncbi:hypothetical protein OAT16_10395, partial [Prolixibacteraceae bacterium]|nr:hypothetical protein [Prolixibacteraceae bacterium]